jgi:hypothetical protein
MSLADPRLIARQYQQTRERLVDVLANPDTDWDARVPACPE